MSFRALLGCAVLLAVGQTAWAQPSAYTPRTDEAAIPSYEVVSIHKVSEPKVGRTINNERDGWIARDCNLFTLIGEAYSYQIGELNDQQVEGAPAWAKTQLFDIHAKVDAGNAERLRELDRKDTMLETVRALATRTPSPRMLMLQRMLESRFALKVHYEQRTMPIYEMTVAKGGVKMQAAHPKDPENGTLKKDMEQLVGENVPMAFIPSLLALEIKRPVEDKTRVGGSYDFALKWSEPENGDTGDNGLDRNAPSFFTAVQEQLGLRLRPAKAPVWVIVVDHVAMPSEN